MIFVEESKFKKEIGIYKIVNLANGKVYIGQTGQNFQRRYWHHQWKLRNNSHDNKYLQNAWNKYGEDNFSFEVVEITTKDSLDEREKFWIEHYRNTVGCYSIQDGGQPHDLTRYITPEMRKLVGEKNRQRLLGSKASEETRKKMAKTRKGKHPIRKNDVLTPEQAKQVKQMLISGIKSKDICSCLEIPYKGVNSIISNNNYSAIKVDGWEEWYENYSRHRKKRLTKAQISEIVYKFTHGKEISELAQEYDIKEETVRRHIRVYG